jgi:hypothetical protein
MQFCYFNLNELMQDVQLVGFNAHVKHGEMHDVQMLFPLIIAGTKGEGQTVRHEPELK